MKLNIPIILGTSRPGNKSQHMAKFVYDILSKRDDITTEIIDPASLDLPADGNNEDSFDPSFSLATERADGFVLIVPEYNHSFSGSLKRMLDSEYDNYYRKSVALVGVSSGGWGGIRAVELLLPVLRALGLSTIKRDVFTTDSYNRFGQDGEMVKDVEVYEKNVNAMIDELVWITEALKAARG